VGTLDALTSVELLTRAANAANAVANYSFIVSNILDAFITSANTVLGVPLGNAASSFVSGFCVNTFRIVGWPSTATLSSLSVADAAMLEASLSQALAAQPVSELLLLSAASSAGNLTVQYQVFVSSLNSAAVLAAMTSVLATPTPATANQTLLGQLRARSAVFVAATVANVVAPAYRDHSLPLALETFVKIAATLQASGQNTSFVKSNVYVSLFNFNCTAGCAQALAVANNTLSLPADLVINSTAVSFIVYPASDSARFFPDSTLTTNKLDSSIVSIALTNSLDTSHLPVNFQFTVQSINTTLNTPVCSYYDLGLTNRWLGTGCSLFSRTATAYTCSCNHMTNFAVLSSLQSSSVTTDPVLTYITYVGLGLSIPSLLLLILVFLFLKNIMNMHRYILVNLAFTLGVATTLFVFGVDMTSSSLCYPIAIGMHYFLTSAFCWMLLDGYHLYLTFVAVFLPHTRPRDFLIRTIFAYLAPAVVVVVSSVLLGSNYRRSDACWIAPGAIWAFAGPVLGILAINLVFFIMILRVIISVPVPLTRLAAQTKVKVMRALKASVVFLPTMGLGWLAGFLAVDRATLQLSYIFTVLCSLQGLFLFLFHVVLDPVVRKELTRRVSPNRSKFFSSGQSKHPAPLPASSLGPRRPTHFYPENQDPDIMLQRELAAARVSFSGGPGGRLSPSTPLSPTSPVSPSSPSYPHPHPHSGLQHPHQPLWPEPDSADGENPDAIWSGTGGWPGAGERQLRRSVAWPAVRSDPDLLTPPRGSSVSASAWPAATGQYLSMAETDFSDPRRPSRRLSQPSWPAATDEYLNTAETDFGDPRRRSVASSVSENSSRFYPGGGRSAGGWATQTPVQEDFNSPRAAILNAERRRSVILQQDP